VSRTLSHPALHICAAVPLGCVLIDASTRWTSLDMLARLLLFFCGAFLVLAGLVRLLKWWRGPHTDAFLWLSTAWLAILTTAAIFADYLPLAESRDPAAVLLEPSLMSPNLLSAHPLGTDTAALDVLGQVIYGARISIVIAVGGSLIGGLIGGALGLIAGYLRGYVDATISFFADVMLSFPPLILIMAMVTILRPSVTTLTIALGILVIPNFCRLSRASTMKIASREYVLAAQTLGARTFWIIVGEILPNVLPTLIAYGFIVMGILTVAEASLSFLGLGIQRPQPTWGNLISQGEQFLQTSPHLVIGPTICLFLTVLSANYIGQHLQKRHGL
jgi:peptide/nickel transport system permease protein